MRETAPRHKTKGGLLWSCACSTRERVLRTPSHQEVTMNIDERRSFPFPERADLFVDQRGDRFLTVTLFFALCLLACGRVERFRPPVFVSNMGP